MKDAWESGDPYEYFMGRWSRLVAQSFIDGLPPSSGLTWLDVGCGTGALSQAIFQKREPSGVIAIDQSKAFVASTQERLGAQAQCRVGNALELPLTDHSVDCAVSGLVLNFIPNPEKALREMRRVTRPGGTVATYIWDYPGKMEFLKYFWDAVVYLDSAASDLHESTRFSDSTDAGLKTLFRKAGLAQATVEAIEIDTIFESFDDFWQPFLGGQGPAPTYVLSLDAPERNELRARLKERLPIQANGQIPLVARAWAASCSV
ncbi:class I SAM-dependent methyltransferase [Marinobacter caseinilyticus]|uniref:class I SAM-dependent methyltransferase n=1 Tax=Marinobacter caseinilyticus TaxID=2692195 RepID=UPI00140B0331|nr:class I SAM-dependent methyltransferase [Marinobacter caseinilyticus]